MVLLISTFLFYGCTTFPDLKEQFYTQGFNFNKYIDKGFLITPGEYKGDYDVMGLIECSVTPEVMKQIYDANFLLTKPTDGTRYYYKMIGTDGFMVKTVNADSLIGFMYKQALEWNADAIINFTIFMEVMPRYDIPVPRVTGTAIKRKK